MTGKWVFILGLAAGSLHAQQTKPRSDSTAKRHVDPIDSTRIANRVKTAAKADSIEKHRQRMDTITAAYKKAMATTPTDTVTVPKGATARCRDGTFSSSAHRRGTCSKHGGVGRWLTKVPPGSDSER